MIAIGHASIQSPPRAQRDTAAQSAGPSIARARGNSTRRSLFPSSITDVRSGAHRGARGDRTLHINKLPLNLVAL